MVVNVDSSFHKPIWDKFNPSQRKAVKAIGGAIQICAVAGSGKTTVLVHRVEHMVNDLKIDPSKIALMTFTGKASEGMGLRLKKLIVKKDFDAMFCNTSHSFGFRVLIREYADLNHPLKTIGRRDPKDPGVLTGSTLKFFAEKVKERVLNNPWDEEVKKIIEETPFKDFLSVISYCKNKDIDWREYESKKKAEGASGLNLAFVLFYKIYEEMKYARRSIDFDDMLFLAVRLLREHPAILRKYQRKYEYVMIDETQDNNPANYALAEMIAYPQNNLFVVGDDDQAMYTFRGADPDLFINFSSRFPNVQQIALEDNYRSRADILLRANKLIAHNTNRIVKQLKAHNKDTDKAVFYSSFKDEIDEAEFVANEVNAICNNPNVDFTDSIDYKRVFVLYRTNAQSKEIEDAFITKGIPYVIHGGVSFYERKEVKDILCYLRLVANQADNDAFKRVINTPSRYLGKAFIEKLSSAGGTSYWANCDKVNLTYSEQKGVDSFKMLVKDLIRMNDGDVPIDNLIQHIMVNGYEAYIKNDNTTVSDEDENNNEVIDKLRFFVSRFKTIEELLNYVELMTGNRKEKVNGVQLMTIHRSKGLEAHAVFGIGFNEGLLPHFASIEKETSGENVMAIEEERRLGYVCGTRAEYLYFASSSRNFNGKPCDTSRFIDEMELNEGQSPQPQEELQTTENVFVGIEAKNVNPETLPVEVMLVPIVKPKIGLGQLEDIVDSKDYQEPIVVIQTQEQEQVEEETEEEEDEQPPYGYIFVDDPYLGKLLQPIPIKKGNVSSKYFA